MHNTFINCIAAEWIKKRRSFAYWLVLAGGLFIPLINLLIFLCYPKQLLTMHASGDFWKQLFDHSWQTMAFMLLPMGIVMAVSLVTQLEYKNNTWKQVHAMPLSIAGIYFSKLVILFIMLLQLFILFNIGTYLCAVIPSLIIRQIPFPGYPIDVNYLLNQNMHFFILSMPIVIIQYAISMHFKNFLIPIGAGLALVIGSLIALSWKFIYLVPYAYSALYFLQNKNPGLPSHNLLGWSLMYSLVIGLLGFGWYVSKKEKG